MALSRGEQREKDEAWARIKRDFQERMREKYGAAPTERETGPGLGKAGMRIEEPLQAPGEGASGTT